MVGKQISNPATKMQMRCELIDYNDGMNGLLTSRTKVVTITVHTLPSMLTLWRLTCSSNCCMASAGWTKSPSGVAQKSKDSFTSCDYANQNFNTPCSQFKLFVGKMRISPTHPLWSWGGVRDFQKRYWKKIRKQANNHQMIKNQLLIVT